ncbi:hypothetical protein ACFZDK_46980 [Streptomyces sp. NPDC007901]|uniref:hypothetical protein n=1 Tax=Streptomyces sp. NPDC007901 TaxID=3364785 RepID=UPI0036E17453
MDDRLARVLDDLHREGRSHDGPLADRLRRLRNMTPDAARLIATLIRARRATSVLEIGTSNGYSAIWDPISPVPPMTAISKTYLSSAFFRNTTLFPQYGTASSVGTARNGTSTGPDRAGQGGVRGRRRR